MTSKGLRRRSGLPQNCMQTWLYSTLHPIILDNGRRGFRAGCLVFDSPPLSGHLTEGGTLSTH